MDESDLLKLFQEVLRRISADSSFAKEYEELRLDAVLYRAQVHAIAVHEEQGSQPSIEEKAVYEKALASFKIALARLYSALDEKSADRILRILAIQICTGGIPHE